MAANTFATMLHRSTHRVVVILVYTLLEWILIALLLLNALFSYLISRFAAFFGLPPPCVFCSRVDHLLDGRGGGESSSIASSHRGFICDAHAAEVSRLGYCSSHRRLAEAGGMCDGCSSSLPSPSGHGRLAMLSVVEKEGEVSRCSCCRTELEGTGFFSPYLFFKPSWRGVMEYAQKAQSASDNSSETDNDEERNEDEIFKEKAGFLEEAKVYPLVSADEGLPEEPAAEAWGDGDDHVIEYEQVAQIDEEDVDITAAPSQDLSPPIGQSDGSCCKKDEVDEFIQIVVRERDFSSNCEHERLVPVEAIDFTTFNNLVKLRSNGEEEEEGELAASEMVMETEGESADIVIVSKEETVEDSEEVAPTLAPEETGCSREFPSHEASAEGVLDFTTLASVDKRPINGEDEGELGHSQMAVEVEGETADVGIVYLADIVEAPIEVVPPTVPEETGGTGESSSQESSAEEGGGVPCDPLQIQTIGDDDEGDAGEAVDTVVDCETNPGITASEDDNKLMDGEANCEVSIGSEICDQEQIYQGALHDEFPPLIDLHDCSPDLNELPGETQEQMDTIIEIEPVQMVDRELDQNPASSPDRNEMEEERPPETPSYVEGLHNLHKRFLFDRREPGTESLDGSVASEVDVSDTPTIDHLKAALKAEHKTLSALYAELEEERSASAIAANQTMAMITRLQEEKAAMQMEALQYQRMMEEQSEYDQEALQLLNELMIKREKEKQDLEKELEIYRKKVLLYEAKERRRLKCAKAAGRSETSCASSSAEDSDDLSLELNDSDENPDGLKESNQNTPTEVILSSGQEVAKHLVTLDESLADFEEERLNIIEQLKALEEKLFTLDDGEEHSPVDLEILGHIPGENGRGHDGEHESHNSDVNEYVVDDLDTNGKHHYASNNVGCRGKNLLPLFDAISMENEDGSHEQTEESGISPGLHLNLNSEQKKLAIAEEVDNVYERLQALEADTEFLKHCLGSLKRGDKGMDLLQEILQHLRDLRSVELRVKNAGDTIASI